MRMTRARRLRGACVGYTFGGFDLFNVEHLDLLRQAATHCDELMAIVGSVRGVGRVVPLDTWDLAAAAREVGAEVLLTVTNGDAVQRAADPAAETAGIRVHRLIPRRRSAS